MNVIELYQDLLLNLTVVEFIGESITLLAWIRLKSRLYRYQKIKPQKL